jgi:tRNA(Ile2) C34 agmatinyltransferase TiaS
MQSERVIHVERRLKLTERDCAFCGTAFMGWGRQRFCTPSCRRRWDYRAHAEARRSARREHYRRASGAAPDENQS